MAARAAAPVSLPTLTATDPDSIITWANAFSRAVALELARIAGAAGATRYQVTNPSPSRTLDASTATLPQVATVLATALQDIQAKGFLG